MNTIQSNVSSFIAACKANGFTFDASRDSVIRIERRIAIGDKAAFCDCDMSASDILSLVPMKGGSVWGTDGGSIGGHAALMSGRFVMNKSGESAKRFMTALRKAN